MLGVDGAERHGGAVTGELAALRAMLAHLPRDRAGTRLGGHARLRDVLARDGAIGAVAARVLGPATRAVRATLFDKTATANWSLAWRQDRTICVRERIEVAGFGPWMIDTARLAGS